MLSFDSLLNSSAPNESYIPIYMRSSKGQTTSNSTRNQNSLVVEGNSSQGDNDQNEDETLLKAYAAVLGLDWFGDKNNDNQNTNENNTNPTHPPPPTTTNNNNKNKIDVISQEGDNNDKDTLHNIITNLQNIRQKTPVSPQIVSLDTTGLNQSINININEDSLTTSKDFSQVSRLSAPKPPKPKLSTKGLPLKNTISPSISVSNSKKSENIPSNDDKSSCDDSVTSIPNHHQQQSSLPSLDQYERELDDDLREYLHSYQSTTGGEGEGGENDLKNKNSMKSKRLLSSHSANSVVKAARIESEQQYFKESLGINKQNKGLRKVPLKSSFSTGILPSVQGGIGIGGGLGIGSGGYLVDKLPDLSSNRLGIQSFSLSQNNNNNNLKKKNQSQARGGAAKTLESLDSRIEQQQSFSKKNKNQLNMTIN